MTARPDGASLIARTIDLPVSIVWDALVDPVLVEGWLHPSLTLLDGVVHERIEQSVLDTESSELGRIRVTLGSVPGGTRDSSTLVELALVVRPARLPATAPLDLDAVLDRLEDLLRGHPTDWAAVAAASARGARSAR